jgi:hypothetical protein
MADLYVDLDGLRALSGNLSGVVDQLANSDPLSSLGDAVGHPRVLGAVQGFRDHWRSERQKIHDDCATLQTMVDESVNKYVSTDSQLATQMRESDGSTE